MSIDIINDRLKSYSIDSKQAELNAIKEISQEVALAGLSRAGFFKYSTFQGGTCLRIVYGLKRFSEDLDFVLNKPDKEFRWEPYLAAIKTEFDAFGLSLTLIDRTKASDTVKKAFLKENSFGKVLNLHYERAPSDMKTISIKLEIDTNPPEGSVSETHVLDYPYPLPIITQNLPSLFAGKCHALLCRKFIKGRDWFDFIWYIQNQVVPNYQLLQNAFMQYGPYEGKLIDVSHAWLTAELAKRIESLDWKMVADDVKKFLPNDYIHAVEAWNKDLFLALLRKLAM